MNLSKTLIFLFASNLIFKNCHLSSALFLYTLQNEFSATIRIKGLEGSVLFIKNYENEPTIIKTQFHGSLLKSDGFQWEIRHLPSLHYYSQESLYCSNLVLNSALIYNFTRNYGLVSTRGVYISEDIPMTEDKNSILGSSIVIMDKKNAIACATILPINNKNIQVYSTKLNEGLGGEIYFLDFNKITLVMGYVYGLNENIFEMSINWKLVKLPSNEVISNNLNTNNTMCNNESKKNCATGELGVLSEFLLAKKANKGWSSMHHFRHIFSNLKINSNIKENIGLQIEPLARVNIKIPSFPIKKIEQNSFKIDFIKQQHDIKINLVQESPYHTPFLEALIANNSDYLKDTIEMPSFRLSDSIPNTNLLPNLLTNTITLPNTNLPTNTNSFTNTITLPKNATNKKENINTNIKNNIEKSKYEEIFEPNELGEFPPLKNITTPNIKIFYPISQTLFGTKSIIESVLTISFKNQQNDSTSVSGYIRPNNSKKTIQITIPFKDQTDLFGQKQYVYNESFGELIIWINLENKTGKKTTGHMIHIHEYQADIKSPDIHWKCSVTAGHFNPFKIPKDELYNELCSNTTIYYCEIGDLDGKSQLYNVGEGLVKIVDPTIELIGKNTIISRSLVIHGANKNKDYIGCENIITNS